MALLRGATTMVKDPVCGMLINEQTAGARSEYHGKTYYFCSPACKSKFDKDPEQYAAK
jgi:YHS domain-containing protein